MRQLGPPTIQAYASSVLRQSRKLNTSWIKRHWFDIVLLSVLPMAWLLFRYVSRQNFPHGKSRQVVVSSQTELPPFRIITSSDVTVENVETIAGSLGKLDEVVGHYPVQGLPPRTIVKSDRLSAKKIDPGELSGREILPVPVKLGSLAGSRNFPLRVSLLLSPKAAGMKPIIIPNAYLLATTEVNGTTIAMAAVSPEQLRNLAPLLGTSDVFVSVSMP